MAEVNVAPRLWPENWRHAEPMVEIEPDVYLGRYRDLNDGTGTDNVLRRYALGEGTVDVYTDLVNVQDDLTQNGGAAMPSSMAVESVTKLSTGTLLMHARGSSLSFLFKSVDDGANWGNNHPNYDNGQAVLHIGSGSGTHEALMGLLIDRGIAEGAGKVVLAEYNTNPEASVRDTGGSRDGCYAWVSEDDGSTWTVLFETNTASETLGTNPFTTTNTSAVVQVDHPSHDLIVGNQVRFENLPGAINGIPQAEFEADQGPEITTVIDADTYEITLTTPASSTGAAGGAGIDVYENRLRHFHCVKWDPYRRVFLFGFGDHRENSGFLVWDPAFEWQANNVSFETIFTWDGFDGLNAVREYNATDFIVLKDSDWVVHVTDGLSSDDGTLSGGGLHRFKPSDPSGTFEKCFEPTYAAGEDRRFAYGVQLPDGTIVAAEFGVTNNTLEDFYLWTSDHKDGLDWKKSHVIITPNGTTTWGLNQMFVSMAGELVFAHGDTANKQGNGTGATWMSHQGDHLGSVYDIADPVFYLDELKGEDAVGLTGNAGSPDLPGKTLEYWVSSDHISRGARIMLPQDRDSEMPMTDVLVSMDRGVSAPDSTNWPHVVVTGSRTFNSEITTVGASGYGCYFDGDGDLHYQHCHLWSGGSGGNPPFFLGNGSMAPTGDIKMIDCRLGSEDYPAHTGSGLLEHDGSGSFAFDLERCILEGQLDEDLNAIYRVPVHMKSCVTKGLRRIFVNANYDVSTMIFDNCLFWNMDRYVIQTTSAVVSGEPIFRNCLNVVDAVGVAAGVVQTAWGWNDGAAWSGAGSYGNVSYGAGELLLAASNGSWPEATFLALPFDTDPLLADPQNDNFSPALAALVNGGTGRPVTFDLNRARFRNPTTIGPVEVTPGVRPSVTGRAAETERAA